MVPLYVSNPEQWIQNITNAHEYVCIVMFRGHWSEDDRRYLTQDLGSFFIDEKNLYSSTHSTKAQSEHSSTNSIHSKSTVYRVAWTSEGMRGAKKADEAWGLTSQYKYDEVIGDETCALAKYLKDEEGLLPDLIVSDWKDIHVSSPHHQSHFSGKKNMDQDTSVYPNGLVQPGLIFYAHHGVMVLYWEGRLKKKNKDGRWDMDALVERPIPSEIWRKVQKRKHALDVGNAILPVNGNTLKTCKRQEDHSCILL